MPKGIYGGMTGGVIGALLCASCSTVPPTKAVSGKQAPARTASQRGHGIDSDSSEELNRRAEGHAHYATAVIHELNGEAELAVKEYYEAALLDVGNEGLVLDVSRRLLHAKQNENALKLLTRSTERPDASGPLFARLGLVCALMGKKGQAIQANRTAIQKAPLHFPGYQHLAQIHWQQGQAEEGLKVLDQAARQPKAGAEFLLDLAELYAGFSRTGKDLAERIKPRTLEVLNRVSSQDPAHPLLLQRLADGYALLGESDKATDVYLKLLERFPRLPGFRERLAEIYLRKQDRPRATEQLQAIIRDNPTHAQAYYFLGLLAFEDKKFKEAADQFRKTVLLQPDFEPAYYDLAGAQMNGDQARDALITLEKAKARFRENFAGEFFQGLAYSRLKEYTNALAHFTAAEVIARATETNRLTAPFYFQMGAAYERTQNYTEAESYFRKCLSLSPEFSEALNYLGYMWAERGLKLGEARELIEKAVQLEPKNAAYLDSLAWVLFKLEKPQEALDWMLKAIEQADEPDPTLFDHLGDIYAALQRPDQAREAWRKALAIEPNAEIQKKLGATVNSETARPPP